MATTTAPIVTAGRPEVTDILLNPNGSFSRGEMLRMAAAYPKPLNARQ